MTDKEKAADAYKKTHDQNSNPNVFSKWSFLAGCAYQEQVNREVIEGLVNALKIISIGESQIDMFTIERFSRADLIDVAENALAAYHKATGQETEKE